MMKKELFMRSRCGVWPRGVATVCLLSGLLAVSAYADRYVWTNSPSPAAPYTTWQSAAHTIQEAVDAASVGETVWVTNGVYEAESTTNYLTGVHIATRVALNKAVHLRSVNGYASTIIEGLPATNSFAVRCVFMTNGASIAGFTIRYGGTDVVGAEGDRYGGGIFALGADAVVSNCYFDTSLATRGAGIYGGLVYNSVFDGNEANDGGGAAGAVLQGCLLQNNIAFGSGGAVVGCALTNCTLMGNTAQYGGASYESSLYGCVVKENSASRDGGAAYLGSVLNCTIYSNHIPNSGEGGGTAYASIDNSIVQENKRANGTVVNYKINDELAQVNNSCTVPKPALGSGNTAADPRFVDPGSGDFALLPLSPAVNAGATAGWMSSGVDWAGNARVYESIVDMGALEWQGASNTAAIRLSGDLAFGYVTTGMTARQTMTIHNDGPDTLAVLRIRCPDGFSGSYSGQVASGASTNITIEFSPLTTNAYGSGATIIVDSYATSGDDTYTCSGTGTPLQIPSDWLAQYGLPTNRTDKMVYEDFMDPDGDGMSTWAEWRSETDPTNALSFFKFTYTEVKGEQAVEMVWVSATNRTYTISRCTNLQQNSFSDLVSGVPGDAGTTAYTNTDGTVDPLYIYRIEVDE